MKINLLDTNKPATLPDKIFGKEQNIPLVHQIVVAELAGQRQGTKANKSRSEVAGGGRKPWRQKGTGRARVGSSNNPIWRGGGVTFAAKPRNFKQKVNVKMRQGALLATLSSLLKDKRLEVISALKISQPKTKELVQLLLKLGLDPRKTRINLVTKELDDNLLYAARNLQQVQVISTASLLVSDLIAADKSLFTEEACKDLSKRLSK